MDSSVDQCDGLKIQTVPQLRGPAFHTSEPCARGRKCGKTCVGGVCDVFDDAAGSSVDSLVVDFLQRWQRRPDDLLSGLRNPL